MKTITLTNEQHAVLRALLEWTCGDVSGDTPDASDDVTDDEDEREHIEAAQISQTGADAVMVLRVDRPVDTAVLDPIGAAVGARTVRSVDFG